MFEQGGEILPVANSDSDIQRQIQLYEDMLSEIEASIHNPVNMTDGIKIELENEHEIVRRRLGDLFAKLAMRQDIAA